jgi:peptidoglycan biosynthesis protein MviN/MurJ (putative lipid II flippase)
MIGCLILVVATIPFTLIGAATPYVVIGAAMVVRGIGIGLSIMPSMTAAFSVLRREQINDASPTLTVLMRVGGSLGTAIIAVVLQGHLSHAHTEVAQAASFAHTYWWVMAVSLIALVPTLLLVRVERRARADRQSASARPAAPVLEPV